MGGSTGKALGTSGNTGIGSWMPEMLNPSKWTHDVGGASNAASNLKTASDEQAAQAAHLEQLTLQKPQTISPDNFLASKTNALANLRLGLASTITGAGGAPSAVLSAPSLTAGGSGKTKLGS